MNDLVRNKTALTDHDLAAIQQHAQIVNFQAESNIFSEGDEPDGVYFIQSGHVSIVTRKFTEQTQLCTLGPGGCFGEMAVLNKGRRTASAIAESDCKLFKLDQSAFLVLMEAGNSTAGKINNLLAARYEELILTENLLASTGLKSNKLHVSIKGDPSLRESAFSRERYDSIADKALTQLLPVLEDLILNRCAYQFFLSLSSEEVRIMSVFEPFGDHVHSCNKLLDKSYIDRHFPLISYDEKSELIRYLYTALSGHNIFRSTPVYYKKVLSDYYSNWQPVSKEEIKTTLGNIPVLRTIPNFYIRNFSISMVHDVIRMQFNCDGTHIVSNEDLLEFMKQNIG